MLEVSDLFFGYKKRKPLFEELSFTVSEGEFLVIIGPNGAGKSSLLKLISGTNRPQKGEVKWNGKKMTDFSAVELAKQRAVLTQFTTVGFDFSVSDVVIMGRYPYFDHIPHQRDIDIAEKAMSLTGVGKYRNTNYQELSGGEQQRVQLARVIAQIWSDQDENKGLLLLDEPVSSLDLLHQHKVLQTSREMAGKGFSVIAVLHDLNLSLAYADRVMLVNNGEVVVGTPEEVITEENIYRAFEMPSRLIRDEESGRIQVLSGWHPHEQTININQ